MPNDSQEPGDEELVDHTHHTQDSVPQLMRRAPKPSASDQTAAPSSTHPHVDLNTMRAVERLLSGNEPDEDDPEPDLPTAS